MKKNSEYEKQPLSFQQKNRTFLPEIWETMENPGFSRSLPPEISKETINLFKKEMESKNPFESLKNANKNPTEKEELMKLAYFFTRSLDLFTAFDGILLNYLIHGTPDEILGIDLSYIIMLFGPGEGLLDKTTDSTGNAIKKTLND